MTAIQLNVALHREFSYIETNSTMMERALKSLCKIRKEWKAEQKTLDTESANIPKEYRSPLTKYVLRATRFCRQKKCGVRLKTFGGTD